MEFLFELIFEILFQFGFELIADVLFGKTASERPILRVAMLLIVGGLAGGLSLLIFPQHLIRHGLVRYAAVIFAPALIGCVMAMIGRFRDQRGKEPRSLEHFAAGWAFAFAFGTVRVLLAA